MDGNARDGAMASDPSFQNSSDSGSDSTVAVRMAFWKLGSTPFAPSRAYRPWTWSEAPAVHQGRNGHDAQKACGIQRTQQQHVAAVLAALRNVISSRPGWGVALNRPPVWPPSSPA